MGKISSLIRDSFGKKRFNSAVILAAGNGTRFSEEKAKQFTEILGVPLLVRSALAFEESDLIHEIVVVTRSSEIDNCRKMLRSYGITKATRIVQGGETRQESAKNGFDAVNPACDFVAIHDAARCLVTSEMIEAVIESAYVDGAAVAASKVTDTIKRTSLSGIVKETISREDLWAVQTPQVFMADMYRAAAYTAVKDNFAGTDDSILCERIGFGVRMVDCGRTNIKITYPEDVLFAEKIIETRETTEKDYENRTWLRRTQIL